MNPTDKPRADPHVVLEEFDDWAVLFHPFTGEAFGVGPVGVTIWQALDGRRTLAQVAAVVAAQCEDAPPTVLADTLAFVEDLWRRLFLRMKVKGGRRKDEG
jgi:Coenzyme PQQ synthesis protein D (PqqD)